jgi:hypothetical protein
MAELIADCAAIPVQSRSTDQDFSPARAAEPWHVDDACYAQVSDVDVYI